MPPDAVLKSVNLLHRAVLKLSGGRLGWDAGSMPVLELTTTGRKSGQRRSVMLTSPLQEGSTIVIVASRGGDDQHPAWFLNLRDDPAVEVSMRGEPNRPMVASVASPEERARLWPTRHRRSRELRGVPDQDRSRDPAGAAEAGELSAGGQDDASACSKNAAALAAISSSETSSMWVAMDHFWPNGSRTWPDRSP